MNMIEIDQEVSTILAEKANILGITRNDVLRQLLGLNTNVVVNYNRKNKLKYKKQNHGHQINGNIQDELIPYIVKIIYENGGKATKAFVEGEIFRKFYHKFVEPYYNENTRNGTPKWKNNIAWAKERAKQIHGFIKSPDESGLGIWELTDKGIAFYEKELKSQDID